MPEEEAQKPVSEITASAFRRGGVSGLAMLKEAVDDLKVVEDDPTWWWAISVSAYQARSWARLKRLRELKLVLALDQNKFIRARRTPWESSGAEEEYLQAEHYFKDRCRGSI